MLEIFQPKIGPFRGTPRRVLRRNTEMENESRSGRVSFRVVILGARDHKSELACSLWETFVLVVGTIISV